MCSRLLDSDCAQAGGLVVMPTAQPAHIGGGVGLQSKTGTMPFGPDHPGPELQGLLANQLQLQIDQAASS